MESKFSIKSFSAGMNQGVSDGLLKPFETNNARNCVIDEGSLRTFREPVTLTKYKDEVHSLINWYSNDGSKLLVGTGENLECWDNPKDFCKISGHPLDYINFEYKGEKSVVCVSPNDDTFLYNKNGYKKLLNRRKKYGDTGNIESYVDSEGASHSQEEYVKTLAPRGEFILLHYDRLWIAGDKENPDRLYFSTANINGADIEDWTAPTIENEANMHGGFIDIRSYDGSKINGIFKLFDDIVVFKDKTAYKIFGSDPSNYQMVELFSCNGSISDKSIVSGNNGCYFLSNDGIYFYDGTNTDIISDKVKNVIANMNHSYAMNSVGIFKNNCYYLALPTGDSTKNNTLLVHDVLKKSFMVYDISTVNCFCEYGISLLFANDNCIKQMYSGDKSMPMYWETPNVDFETKNSRKVSSRIYFRGRGEGNVRITLTSDRGISKSIEIPLTKEEKLYKPKLKNKGRMLKLKFENVDNSNIEITFPELIFEVEED